MNVTAATLSDLDPARCLLVPAALVGRCNDLARLLRDGAALPRLGPRVEQILAGEPPSKGETEEEKDRREAQSIGWIAERLARPRFQIGFLGRNQIGKSSALNNILDIDKDRAPSEEGNFEATTSVISRIRFRPRGGDALTVTYLDEAGYRSKRDTICSAIDVRSDLDDPTLLNQELPERIRAIQRGEGRSLALSEDPAYLAKFIKSYLTYGPACLGRTVSLQYAQRRQYLNHNHRDPAPTEAMLLREAVIDFESALIDPRLELIDLPGVGAHISVDTVLSRRFMKDLDGALVFQSLRGLSDADTEGLFARLGLLYGGRFEDRVWLVIAYFDGLTATNLEGSDSQESVFDKVAHLAERRRVPPGQVCLLSNTLYQNIRKDRKLGRELTPMERARHIGVSSPDGVPAYVARHSGLVDAYKALLDDGGIGRLRGLLKDRLVPALARQREAELAEKLTSVCRKFRTAVEFIAKTDSLALLPQVNKCLKDTVYPRLEEMETRTTLFDAAVAHLRTGLLEFFRESLFPDVSFLDDKGLDYLKERFPGHAAKLREYLAMLLEDAAKTPVGWFYDQVGRDLPQQPEIPVAGQPSVRAAWEDFKRQDVQLDRWFWKHPAAPRFDMPEFFAALEEAGVETFTGRDYRDMMHEKIRRCAHQTCHLLRRQLWVRLNQLREGLEDLTRIREEDNGQPTSPRAYDELLSRMGPLCQ
jgi:hypothetical protein